MKITAQGTAGAGKTTVLRELENGLTGALYIPELYVPFPEEVTDEYFFENDRQKQILAKTATTALVDRDELSTLSWIGTRDGLTARSYRDAYDSHRRAIESSQVIASDVYLHFTLPFSISRERQAKTNHPAWKDERFVQSFEDTLQNLMGEFIPSDSIRQIDGQQPKDQVLQTCHEAIDLAAHRDSPYINYRPERYAPRKPYTEQLACVVLKPDCIERGLGSLALDMLARQNIQVLAERTKVLSERDVQQLWSTFWTQSWWNETRDYMTSGPSTGLLCRLSGQVNYDTLTSSKKQFRGMHRDPLETRKCVSLLHTADSIEETERNVLSFWGQNELDKILEN